MSKSNARFNIMPAKRERFVNASRRTKKIRFIKLKNALQGQSAAMQADASSYLPSFNLEGAGEGMQYSFFMLGKKRNDVYEVIVLTASEVAHSQAIALARDKVEKALDEAGLLSKPQFSNAREAVRSMLARHATDDKYDIFEGRTRNEQIRMVANEILAKNPPKVLESIAVDLGAKHAIILTVIVDVPVINHDVCESITRKLKATGPVAFKEIKGSLLAA